MYMNVALDLLPLRGSSTTSLRLVDSLHFTDHEYVTPDTVVKCTTSSAQIAQLLLLCSNHNFSVLNSSLRCRDNTAAVRRLSSSGDFGLVLVHAAAHIQVDPSDMSNDLDPRFTQHFHRALKILTQGLWDEFQVFAIVIIGYFGYVCHAEVDHRPSRRVSAYPGTSQRSYRIHVWVVIVI